MTEFEWRKAATEMAALVYRRFLTQVVEAYVIKDRLGGPLGEKTRKKVESETMIDPRIPRLMAISGKGGIAPDPEKQAVYSNFFNVSLLDHLLSVTRGAITLAALDWMGQNPEMDPTVLKRRLCVLAVVAFCHDLDKDLRLPRNTQLETPAVLERMSRYGIDAFLASVEVSLTPDVLRYLVQKVEATQAHRTPPAELPPRAYESLPLYARLADRLDGTWLSTDAETGGLKGVIRLLSGDQSCLHTDLLRNWKPVHLFDPHHPFILDELQKWLSLMSLELSGVSPLIEVHQDGHLFMLIPGDAYHEITANALDRLCHQLPFNLKLDVSNRGVPSLYNGQPSHKEMMEFTENRLTPKNFTDLFKIKNELMASLDPLLDDLLSNIGLPPKWPTNPTGALTTIYATLDHIDPADREWLSRAVHLVLLLNLKVDARPKGSVPSPPEREKQLLTVIRENRPDWITDIPDDASRRTVTALWAATLAAEDVDILDRVWEANGCLLQKWLEGGDNCPGFNRFILREGAAVVAGVRNRLECLLAGKRVAVENESAKGRCIFTDEPVDFNRTINQASGLYGVKVSAFSGREGRPELINSERSHTNVGFASMAEHKIRAEAHEIQGGRESGTPTLVSSPTTSGLFGGLGLTDDRAMGAMSLYDLTRYEVKKGRVLKGIEAYQGRHRMARLERIPEPLKGQVDFLRMLLTAARRLGRPIHLFRGLPTLRKEYFYFDGMPRILVELLGDNGLYLEELPIAIDQLRMAFDLLETNGLGYDVLKRYAAKSTRFGAICLARCHLQDREQKRSELSNRLYREFTTYMEDETIMNEQEGALVRLGRAAAGIQKNPGVKPSANEELMVFKICLDAANEARRIGQEDAASLVYAVAGELETNLVRKQKAWETKIFMDNCFAVAELFVNDVWFGVLEGKSPTQKSRRILSSIYRMAFLKTHHDRVKENRNNTQKEDEK
ncbi:conserved hypothetical protein [delta proteobacterium NaphS2]|nr:conserved hypothetical protein [delta proteobacterium NaphS2]